MRKLVVLFVLSLSILSCNDTKKKETTKNDDTQVVSMSLKDFDADAQKFVGKIVKVEGIIDHVCKHSGKKLLLVQDDSEIHVISKKERFDEKLTGSKASITGLLEEERIDSVYLAEELKHKQESLSDGSEENKEKLEKYTKNIHKWMDSLKKSGKPYFSNYKIKLESLTEIKE